MNNCLTRWCHTGLIFWGIVTGIWGVATSAPAMQISVTPSAPTVGEPVTFTATGCSDCFNYLWSGAVGGSGIQVVQTFQNADTYTVQVQATQQVCIYYPYYDCWYAYPSATKQIEITSDEFTIKILSSAGGTVIAGDGDVDASEPGGNGIACSGSDTEGMAECQETYRKEQVVSLKIIPDEGRIFLGWRVNGKIVSKEELLQMLQ